MALADHFECTIDFEGQYLAENLTYAILIVASFIGFFTGYVFESIQLTLTIFAVGFAVACLLVIPPWPMYRRKTISWTVLKPSEKKETPGSPSTLNEK